MIPRLTCKSFSRNISLVITALGLYDRDLAFNIHESMKKYMYVGVGLGVCVESQSSSDPDKPGSKFYSTLNT